VNKQKRDQTYRIVLIIISVLVAASMICGFLAMLR